MAECDGGCGTSGCDNGGCSEVYEWEAGVCRGEGGERGGLYGVVEDRVDFECRYVMLGKPGFVVGRVVSD